MVLPALPGIRVAAPGQECERSAMQPIRLATPFTLVIGAWLPCP